MQINGKREGLDEILDVGVEVFEKALESLQKRGLTFDLGSSVLAVAVAGAMTHENISEEQFLEIIRQTLRFWKLERRQEGPVLIFNASLSPVVSEPSAIEEPIGAVN